MFFKRIQKLITLQLQESYITKSYRFSTASQQQQSLEQQKQQEQQQQKQSNETTSVQKKEEDKLPLHLRPYDKEKYEVPSSKIKYSTGYALLDVEPFPRSKIMKLCYNILDKVKETPEDSMYRIYTEEKIKYVMKITDEIEDIKELEEELNNDSIELFIQSLFGELELVDHMKEAKPWEFHPDSDDEFIQTAKIKVEDLKHLKHIKPEREQTKFIQ